MLQSGRKIVLSEAGKFALNETKIVKKVHQQPQSATIKIIKKGPTISHQSSINQNLPTKKNKIIKVLSSEEFKQICKSGDDRKSNLESSSGIK